MYKRSLRALTCSQRRLLRLQWLQSGTCARCFHASLQQRVKENSNKNDVDTPYNTPKRGPTRHERSSKISNEISMLQNGPPPHGDLIGPGSVTGTYHAPPKAPTSSAGFLESPDDMGGSRMGENTTAGREGPNAQGVGRPIRYEDREDAPQDNTIMARGVRSSGSVEEPAEGGASVLSGDRPERGHHLEWVERSGREDKEINQVWSQKQAARLRNSKALGIPFKPVVSSESNLLQNGNGSSTIAAKNFEGAISDRLRSLSVPSSPDATTRPKAWKDISNAVTRSLRKKMISGEYDPDSLLSGQKHKQPTLNGVAKMTMLNESYLQGDADRLLKKVQSLLPIAQVSQQQSQKTTKKSEARAANS